MSFSGRAERRHAFAALMALALALGAVHTVNGADEAKEDLSPKTKDPQPSYKNTTGAGHYFDNKYNGGGYGSNNYGGGGYGGSQPGGYDQGSYSNNNNYGGGYSGYNGGNGNYGGGGYGGGYGGNGYDQDYGYNHHLVDDYVCDVDASILVVTNSENAKYDQKEYKKGGDYDKKADYNKGDQGSYGSSTGNYGGNYGGGYGGGNNYGPQGYGGGYTKHAIAHRLRCSVVAIHNDTACSTCCQLAARRDKSIAKERIIGFIVDNNQIHQSNAYRKKRDAAQPPAPPPPSAIPTTKTGDKSHGNDNYVRPVLPIFPPLNARCVCCAPKHHYNNHYVGDYGKQYGQPQYGAGDYGQQQQYGSSGYAQQQQQYGQPAYVGNIHGQQPSSYNQQQPNGYGQQRQYAQKPSYGVPPPTYGGYGHEQPNYQAPPPSPVQPYKQ